MRYFILFILVLITFSVNAQKRGKTPKPIEKIIVEGAGGIGKIFYDYIYRIEKPGADTTYHVKIQYVIQDGAMAGFDAYIYIDSQGELTKMITELEKTLPNNEYLGEEVKGEWHIISNKRMVQLVNEDSRYVALTRAQVKSLLSFLEKIEGDNKLPK